ncbi:hypothetical protein AVEN_131440-1 [Araneus ventricosus]|uniref:Uncharacterized protein n=1 Tax=Araneus ventricosus TaxID=182803 RepID=A0A4Y2W550_ARAVE|nr:hypothetical protein AVEN_131440-1 [Araneus ventricosus]
MVFLSSVPRIPERNSGECPLYINEWFFFPVIQKFQSGTAVNALLYPFGALGFKTEMLPWAEGARLSHKSENHKMYTSGGEGIGAERKEE